MKVCIIMWAVRYSTSLQVSITQVMHAYVVDALHPDAMSRVHVSLTH